MSNLPAPATLAKLASEATQMLFSVPVAFGGECPPNLPDVADGHTVIVPLIGDPLYIVSARSNEQGGVALASIMFECPTSETDTAMIEDSLRELANILAGQVKSILCKEHQLGLPSRLDDDATLSGSSSWAGARLKLGNGIAEVDIAVSEYAGPG